MKVLLTGSNGQVGNELISTRPSHIELYPTVRSTLELSNPQDCFDIVKAIKPDWIINTGAYTSVDKAEKEPEIAMAINAGAPKAFANAILKEGGKLLQISTDFVFGGSQSFPYSPSSIRSPINVYGKSKARGEIEIENLLAKKNQSVILRTSWLMGSTRNNFALTMLKLHHEKDIISVVADQVGSPTTTATLSEAIWKIISMNSDITDSSNGSPQMLHWCNSGVASWYDIAVAVGEISEEIGLIKQKATVLPIQTINYPTPAQRPSYSILDNSIAKEKLKLTPIHWRQALRDLLIDYQIKNK